MLFEIVMNLVYDDNNDITMVTTGRRRIVSADTEADARAYAIADEYTRQAAHQREGTTPYALTNVDIVTIREAKTA